MNLKEYLDDCNKIEEELLELISKYFLEGSGTDIYGQVQAALIEAGNNIVNWRGLLK